MADDPEKPPTPPTAAADKPAGSKPAETTALGAEAATDAVAAKAAAPAPASPAPTPSGASAATGQPAPPDQAVPATPAAAKPPAAAAAKAVPPKPAAPAAKPAGAAAGGEAHAPKAAAPTGPVEPPPPADKTPPAFIATMQSAIPGSVTYVSYFVGDWTIVVPMAQLIEVARHLRDAPDALFDFCSDVTATDWPSRQERFDVIYCLYSTRHRHRIRVKVRAAELQPVPSVTGVWPAANWLEREVFDLFGVNFTGHPDRRRILMPEDWQGHPQRKDYPLEGPGELLMENPLDWLKLRQTRDEADIE